MLIAGLALSAMAQNWLDARPGGPLPVDDRLYLTSGEALKHASIGFDGVVADLYWIRTIQYFGGKLEDQRLRVGRRGGAIDWSQMSQLAPLLEIVTELDGHHLAAYRFGAFFLPYLDRERAIRLVQQGIRNNPREWRLHQDLGFIYWRAGRYTEASEAYLRGSRIAGAPLWMEAMAASMLAQGGDRETAREMLRRLCENSEDRFIRGICDEQSELLKQ